MIWVVFALAVGGILVLTFYAVSLVHRAADVKAEIDTLKTTSDQLRTLVGQLELPSGRRD